jgi:hypothetical protein
MAMSDAERERLYREAKDRERERETMGTGPFGPGDKGFQERLKGNLREQAPVLDALQNGDRHLGQSPHERVRGDDVETARNASHLVDSERLVLVCVRLLAEHGALVDDDLPRVGNAPPEKAESYRRRGSEMRNRGFSEWWIGEDGKPVKWRTKGGEGAPARASRITALGREVARTGVLPEPEAAEE